MATYAVTIGGVSRQIRDGSLLITETANGRNRLQCDIYSADRSYRPAIDAEILITEDGTRIFGGVIDRADEAGVSGVGAPGIVTHVSAVDFNVFPSRRVLNLTIPTGTLKAALQALDDYLATYGVTLDAGQVDGPTLPELTFSFMGYEDALNQLATMTGYVWEVDYNKTFRMFDPSGTAAPFNLATGDGNFFGDVTVEPSSQDYATRVLVLAGTGIQDVTDTLTGDGATQDFTLNYSLIAHRGTLTVGGVSKSVGVHDVDAIEWTYESATNQLHHVGAPVGLGVAIVMVYTAQFPVLALAIDAGEEGAGHYQEKLISYPDVFDVTVAQAIADTELARAVSQPRTVHYQSLDTGLHPGQTQDITIPERDLSGTWVITEVKIQNVTGGIVTRSVTAVEGTDAGVDWRAVYKGWNGGGASSVSSVAGAVIPLSTGSGVSGSGSADTLPKWNTTSSLTDSILTESGGAVTVGGALNVTGVVTVSDDLDPATTYASDLGSVDKKYLTLHAAELWVNTLVAQSTLATIGGRILVGPTTTLTTDLAAAGYIITVKNASIFSGTSQSSADVLYMESNGKIEFMQAYAAPVVAVNQGAKTFGLNYGGDFTGQFSAGRRFWIRGSTGNDGTLFTCTGVNSYNPVGTVSTIGVSEAIPSAVVDGYHLCWIETNDDASYYVPWRNLDGSGANDWYAGDAVFNTGQTGTGFIDLYSVRGVKAATEYGPTIVGNVRASTTWNDWAPRWAIGNLNGLYGYATNIYGAAFGVPTAAWIKIDPTNGIRIGHNATTKVQIDASGNASFAGAITASSGTIGSFTIGTYLYTGSKTAYDDANTGVHVGSDGIGLKGASGTFTVSASGSLTASDASLTGSLTIGAYPDCILYGSAYLYGTSGTDMAMECDGFTVSGRIYATGGLQSGNGGSLQVLGGGGSVDIQCASVNIPNVSSGSVASNSAILIQGNDGYMYAATNGFTGTASYTSFTFTRGICTNAS